METSVLVDRSKEVVGIKKAFIKWLTISYLARKNIDPLFDAKKNMKRSLTYCKHKTQKAQDLAKLKEDIHKQSKSSKGDNFNDPNKHIKVSHQIFFRMRSRDILDDYTIIRQLGEGAYGVVKLGLSKKLNIYRAQKFIPKTLNEKNDGKLLNEVIILRSLDHPNIVKMVDL